MSLHIILLNYFASDQGTQDLVIFTLWLVTFTVKHFRFIITEYGQITSCDSANYCQLLSLAWINMLAYYIIRTNEFAMLSSTGHRGI